MGRVEMTPREQRLEAELNNATRQHEACATKLWNAEQRVKRLDALLREWRATADLAMDITFVPIAKKTDAALAEPIAHTDHPLRHFDRTCPACMVEPVQPTQITVSSGAELVNSQRPTAFAAPSEGALMAQTPLETAQEWADWIPYPDSTAAEWDRFNLANGFLRLREKVGSLESCLSIQEDAERHTHTDHLLRHWDRTCPACIAESEQDAAPSSSLRDAAVTAERKP